MQCRKQKTSPKQNGMWGRVHRKSAWDLLLEGTDNETKIREGGLKEHTTLNALTVREVKVMHMPPKPLKVRAMKIRTESSEKDIDVSSYV